MPDNNNGNAFVLPSMSKEALDNLPFGAYVINPMGIIEFFNSAMAEISGVKAAQEIVGQNVLNVPNYQKYGLDKYIKRGLGGEPFRIEEIRYVSYVGKKETIRSYYGIPIKDDKGEVKKLLCIVENVTEAVRNREQIKTDLEEKQVLLKELNHRVKNNMQLINSLFNLRLASTDNEDAKKVIKESQAQIKSMMMIHDKIYEANDLSDIAFDEYVKSLVINLMSIHRIPSSRVKTDIKIKEVKLPVDLAIPLALIVNELVSNSFKYAFPDGKTGALTVDMTGNGEGKMKLVIADDGVGFSNMDMTISNSTGINMVNTLAQQINGSVDISDKQGVKYTIKFPLPAAGG